MVGDMVRSETLSRSISAWSELRGSNTRACDRGHEKLPSGGHLIPHPSGRVLTVWCSCTVDCREDVYEEREDSGGAHRFV